MQICLDVLAARENFREEILAAARQATVDHSPINRPVWWSDPEDVVTHTIDDGIKLAYYQISLGYVFVAKYIIF